MRLLLLHSDFIEYTPISKEIKDAEEIISNDRVRIEDLVVTLEQLKKEITSEC